MTGNVVRVSQNVCKGNRFENTRGAFNYVSARRARDVLVHIAYTNKYQYTARAARAHITERASGHDLRHRKIVNRRVTTPLTPLQLFLFFFFFFLEIGQCGSKLLSFLHQTK